MTQHMIKFTIFAVICFTIFFSVQIAYAEKELPLPEGKNLKEWEAISAALISEKRYEDAMIYLEKILDYDENNLKALANKAGVQIQLEKYSDGIKTADKILKIDPNRISALNNKAIALKMLEKYDESFMAFTEILKIEPDNEKIKNARVNLLRGQPTVTTMNSEWEVHILVIHRDDNENLVSVSESKNSRFLSSKFTERWWNQLDDELKVKQSDGSELFQVTNKLIFEDDYLGMSQMETKLSGHDVIIFEAFMPLIQLEETDSGTIQWSIIKK